MKRFPVLGSFADLIAFLVLVFSLLVGFGVISSDMWWPFMAALGLAFLLG